MSCELVSWWMEPEEWRERNRGVGEAPVGIPATPEDGDMQPCDVWECRECGATTSEDRTGSWPLCGDCWGRLWWTVEEYEEVTV